MCHHNTFLIYGSIENASQKKWDRVTHASLFASFMVSSMFGIAGYATFTGFSQGSSFLPKEIILSLFGSLKITMYFYFVFRGFA